MEDTENIEAYILREIADKLPDKILHGVVKVSRHWMPADSRFFYDNALMVEMREVGLSAT